MIIRYLLPKPQFGVVALFVVAGWMVCPARISLGQAAATNPPALSPSTSTPYMPTLTFDVASVRENKSADLHGGFMVSGNFVADTTTLRLVNWEIVNLISYAYGVDGYQVIGVPKWPWPTVFVIEAKGNSEKDAKMAALPKEKQLAEQRHMLQALLEERFKLKTHWEAKEGDIYNLVVTKGGPKLAMEGSMPQSAEDAKNFGDNPLPSLYQKNDGQGYDYIAHKCSMEELVGMLTSQFGRPVIDKTGLTGNYDFVVRYKGRWDRDREADDMDSMPPLDQALQQQLGLKVEMAKGQVKVLVIDHVEKPSEN